MSDNLYPRATEHYIVDETEELVEAREKEEKAVLDELPIIGEVITNLDEWIDFYKSTDAIPEEVVNDKEKFAFVAYGNKKAVEVLRTERNRLVDLVEDTKSR